MNETVEFNKGGKMAISATGKERLGLKRVGKWLAHPQEGNSLILKKGGKMASSPAEKEQLDLKRVGKWLAHPQKRNNWI